MEDLTFTLTEAEPSAAFSRTDFVVMRMRASNVSDAAHLCYWLEGEASAFHRADLIAQFEELAALVAHFRQSEAA